MNHLSFPICAILISVIAIYFSEIFIAAADSVVVMLALVMFLMGLTLSKQDFLRIRKKPAAIFIGVYSCATVITSILLAPILQLGITYLVLALLFGIYLMYKSYGLYIDKVKPISYFIFSNTYLAVIFLSMVGDIFITLGSI